MAHILSALADQLAKLESTLFGLFRSNPLVNRRRPSFFASSSLEAGASPSTSLLASAADGPKLTVARLEPTLFGLFSSVPLGDPSGDCGVGLSGAVLRSLAAPTMLTTMTVAPPDCELLAATSEHFLFSPGDGLLSGRPATGEAWASKPEIGSVSTDDE